MEQLKAMKETLMGIVQGQLGNIQNVDAKELGEAVDMIKDLAEASYYCTIEEAMKEQKEKGSQMPTENNNTYYYTERIREPYYMDKLGMTPRMYDGNGNGSSTSMSGNTRNYEERDMREGRSPTSRRMYMENKEHKTDRLSSLKGLEKYMKELTEDIVEMISDASLEEKQLLQNKLNVLAQKVVE